MQANSVNYRIIPLWSKTVELTLYSVLAVVLIAHVVFINGPVETINVFLILAGTVFGFVSAFGLTPISDLVINIGTKISADILTLVREDLDQQLISPDSKRAA